MSYKVDTTKNFDKEIKRLSKKFPSLKSEFKQLITKLEQNPTYGIHLGNNIYKIRLTIASKGRGKSGGARVMTYVKIIDQMVYLFSIYNKGEKSSISNKEIKKLIKHL